MDRAGDTNKSPPPISETSRPPGIGKPLTPNRDMAVNSPTSIKLSSKGVENAKKRLRAFSIQKKTPITPLAAPKPSGSGNTTVVIGKLSSVKTTPKPEESDIKKPPKPPKPGTTRKALQDSYSDLQKKTLAEIEDMKRKMELVELGIPLGLICPSATSEKAMPTKAMPPIKSFLDKKSRVLCYRRRCISGRRKFTCCPEKLDEIIREAKKARDEGRKFKFDYQKLLPDYDNPFQKKKEEPNFEKDRYPDRRKSDYGKDDKRSEKYDYKKHSDYKKDDKHKYRYKEKDRSKTETYKKNVEKPGKQEKETDVNLNDYLVCDSWSLDNDDKNNISSPKFDDKHTKSAAEPSQIVKENLAKKNEILKQCAKNSPQNKKIEKLQPVIDSFEYEIDPNDDEILDIFDEKLELENYAHPKTSKPSAGVSPSKKIELDNELYKDISDVNDDTFLESVINEIKQEGLSDDDSNEKGLVEYDISPSKDESPKKRKGSATPDIDDRGTFSQRSDFSGYNSTESYRTANTSESGYKSVESIGSYRLSPEKELDAILQERLPRTTVDSLETWSFVLKICQPLLFRHDKNKCYKETHTVPKIWYTENPKTCMCVKDRLIVYEELESCKMNLVDRVYGCDQIPDAQCPSTRNWYPRNALVLTEPVPMSNEWEADDSQQGFRVERPPPQKSEKILLDREYQRFMEAVESKVESSRSTTPVRQESKKKSKEEVIQRVTDDKKTKKINTEDWSQESEVEAEFEKGKKLKEKEKSKLRKRKHSSSSQSSLSDSDDSKKKNKAMKKKAMKKAKSKSAKRRRIGRKILKKLKEKGKKKKKSRDSDDDDIEDKKKYKKAKRKKQLKLKKKLSKKKKARAKSSSSSDSYTSDSYSSESDSESDRKSKKAKKKSQQLKKKKSKKRKQSTSDSTQSEELFDVNILNNIKTERVTDDEESKKLMDFSPRRQKPREIINVKELQNDFVGSNIQIKKEVEEEIIQKEPKKEIDVVEACVEDSPVNNSNDEQIPQIQKTVEVKKLQSDLKTEAEIQSEIKELPETGETIEVISTPEPKTVSEVRRLEVRTLPEDIPLPEARVATESRAIPEVRVLPVERAIPEIRILSDIRILPEVKAVPEDSNISQSSSQESVISVKDPPSYEKDDSYLRPSSQNSNYSFHDVIGASQIEHYPKHADVTDEDKYSDGYEAGNYEMYEQLAMAYQSDVASQRVSPPRGAAQRIETVVHARSCGEIKCDWRPGTAPERPTKSPRPSRWGLKPGGVNIVLTGGSEHDDQSPPEVFPIPSLANRTEINTGYDEAYQDMYAASDRLQYGDCFSESQTVGSVNITLTAKTERTSSLDARIDQALRDSVLGEVAKEAEAETEVDVPEKGILVTNVVSEASRALKRVSFADGYKPGQDSDVEEPPVKKRKKSRRTGCAWPCPASHPDHVTLWDALPPPPPPPGSPPRRQPPPRALPGPLLQAPGHLPHQFGAPPVHAHQFDPSVPLAGFLPSEPPPALIALH